MAVAALQLASEAADHEEDDHGQDERHAAEEPDLCLVGDEGAEVEAVGGAGGEDREDPAGQREDGGGPGRVVARAVEEVVLAGTVEPVAGPGNGFGISGRSWNTFARTASNRGWPRSGV